MTRRFPTPLLLMAVLAACSTGGQSLDPIPAPPLDPVIDGVLWTSGNWTPLLEAGAQGTSWGNHRAVVRVTDLAFSREVGVTIPWRRADANPEGKAIVVVDSATGVQVSSVWVWSVEPASGSIVFESNPGSPTYYVYYLPWGSTGGYYPKVSYLPATASRPDQQVNKPIDPPGKAEVVRIESVNDFHSFFPMEVVATRDEVASAMGDSNWALFPEHRDRSIRMTRAIPHHWAVQGPGRPLDVTALKGEYFTFQVGVFAYKTALESLQVSFDGFPPEILESMTCFNCGGVDEKGQAFTKTVSVDSSRVQALWIGMQIPGDAPSGVLEGSVTVTPRGMAPKQAGLNLTVSADRVEDSGFDRPEFMSRLAWLNSTVGTDPDFIIDPFTPVEAGGQVMSVLGREVELGPMGLPNQIWSQFTEEVTLGEDTREPVLAVPLELEVTTNGAQLEWTSEPYSARTVSRGRAEWTTTSTTDGLEMRVDGALEYEGMLDYRITLTATRPIQIDEIALPVTYTPGAATWMLGLGQRGGRTPGSLDWKWDVTNHQEGLWIGGINRGLQYVLRDENYVRPLNTNFYQNQPLNLPPSWYNSGKGGILITSGPEGVTARNYSGARTLEAGDELHFNIRFLITPFKPIDTGRHFRTRFVHKYVPVDTVEAWGGTVVNIHHANEINPYINYPFFALDKQTAYIQEAHATGIKVKLYNTIRELTYKAHELFALKSLGDEIINDGEGGGHSWMQEHLRENYHSAWHAWRVDDAAMLNKGTSRWTNYYIEGLSWLARKQEIDGLYLDDIAFSRETVKRLVSVLDEHRDEVVIDLHSANQFNPRDGYINSAMLYMEHFPFISRLWFGEYFDYNADPDYWMTEVSGLPFGLMGEMLQDGGQPWRGLVYGMTARMYGDVDPRPVWKMMNEFGIDESRMMGYWLEDSPLTVEGSGVQGTIYSRPGSALVALGSWSDKDETVGLNLDLEALGMAGDVTFEVPAVEGLQQGAVLDSRAVAVPAGKGLFVVVRRSGGG